MINDILEVMYVYEEKIKIWDEEHREVKELSVEDLEDQLEKIKKVLEKCLEKLKGVRDYDLNSFEVGLSLRAGFFIITAEGSITLTYEKK